MRVSSKLAEKQRVGAHSLTRNILQRVEGHARAPRRDQKEGQVFNHSHKSTQTKQQVG
jgi:hypothetical protein